RAIICIGQIDIDCEPDGGGCRFLPAHNFKILHDVADEVEYNVMPMTEAANKTRDLLVVDDDPELNQLVGAYASIAGFNYRPALNGTDALAESRRHAPAAIVLDLMLPDMSGFDV